MIKQMQDRIDKEAWNLCQTNEDPAYADQSVYEAFKAGATFAHDIMLADMKEMAGGLTSCKVIAKRYGFAHATEIIDAVDRSLANFKEKWGGV